MRLVQVLLFATIALLTLPVAGSDDTVTVDDPRNSLVFGYIDMSDAPTKIDGAWLQQLAPPSDSPYWGMGVEKGLFYNTFIRPGSYQVSSLAGSSFMGGPHEYEFPRQGKGEMSVVVDEPGIYFLGAYKYVKVKRGGMFRKATFTIEPISEPTERELLERILEDKMKVKRSKEYRGPKKVRIAETRWAEAIEARLAELP